MTSFSGTSGNDVFTGQIGNDTAFGAGGNDSLSGDGGADVLVGGAGADTLDGAAGDDVIFSGDPTAHLDPESLRSISVSNFLPILDLGIEADNLNGGAGSDRFFAGYGDTVDGGADGAFGDAIYISFLGAPVGVTADFGLFSQTIGGGTITGIESVVYVQGSRFNDNLNVRANGYGYSGYTTVSGGDGADTLTAGYYTSSLFGDAGDDFLDGRDSQHLHSIDGGSGNDTLYADRNALAFVNGGDGDDAIFASAVALGGSGDDFISMQAAGLGLGEAGDDTIHAGNSGSEIAGGSGADKLIGGVGADFLISADHSLINTTLALEDLGLERDSLAGGDGDDVLSIGYGDNADGEGGRDALRLSLVRMASGVDFDVADVLSRPLILGGGVIQNMETLLYLRSTDFADTLRVASPNAQLTIDGGGGIDTVDFGAAASAVVVNHDGGARLVSVETILGSAFNDILGGDAGDNVLSGAAGSDTLSYAGADAGVAVSLALQGQTQNTGGAGSDALSGFEHLTGSAYNDTLEGDDSANVLKGGSGFDIASYAHAAAAVGVNLSLQGQAQNTGASGADNLAGFEGLIGSEFNDTLVGDTLANSLSGGGGDDILDGATSIDTVSYASANGSVSVSLALQGQAQNTGGGGIDTLAGIENLIGSAFNDTLEGDAGNNVLTGGAGVDTVSYASATVGVIVHLGLPGGQAQLTAAGFDTLSGFENLTGSSYGDFLSGDAGANTLNGGAGVDTVTYGNAAAGVSVSLGLQGQAQITGAAGVDTLFNFENLIGSGFSDTLAGDAGDNVLSGGQGVDMVSYAAATAGVSVNLSVLGAQSTGGAGVDTLAAFESVMGSAYGDTLTGDVGPNDLNGGAGDDLFYNSFGRDTLTSGAGADRFIFGPVSGGQPSEPTRITDFEVGKDVIDLSALLAQSGYAGADPVIDRYLTLATDGAAGTLIRFDSDGAGALAPVTIVTLDNVAPAGLTWAQLTGSGGSANSAGGGSGGGGGGGGGGVSSTGQRFLASPSGDSVQGGAGADTLTGLDGRNTLFGGDGNDQIFGGADFNQVNGNKGADTVIGKSAVGDWLLGGQGDDQVDASASSGHNILNGNMGNDLVVGGSNGDTVRGGQGDDSITAGSGDDWISGDRGNDTIDGGAGADIFHVFKGISVDVVRDFSISEGDRVLVGAGTPCLVTQVGSDTVIDMGEDDRLILLNVLQSTLPPGWIIGV